MAFNIRLGNSGPTGAQNIVARIAIDVPRNRVRFGFNDMGCVVEQTRLFRAHCEVDQWQAWDFDRTYIIIDPHRLLPPRFRIRATVESDTFDPDVENNSVDEIVRPSRP